MSRNNTLVYHRDAAVFVDAGRTIHAQYVTETGNPEGYTAAHFRDALFDRFDSLAADLLDGMDTQANDASQWGPFIQRPSQQKGGDR